MSTTKREDPHKPELREGLEEVEDDRVAAEEAGEEADEDEAAVTDAREGRIPGAP